eukprot:gnl/TRDRNA2_/TRDRNA2_169671_c1_seq1.p1 gnl/TRDRNA2_/TRDRNA2_169671_c1~~gnl/TRDRNA2_/TRDRNA2_169671_c1_seq1.p1  ORF type:complete len:119 (-),score=13.49 gnl/TRDRNA2_/TRDRNA2_169671_c1_seq1:13-369(-)
MTTTTTITTASTTSTTTTISTTSTTSSTTTPDPGRPVSSLLCDRLTVAIRHVLLLRNGATSGKPASTASKRVRFYGPAAPQGPWCQLPSPMELSDDDTSDCEVLFLDGRRGTEELEGE